MTEAEARLRIGQVVERAADMRDALHQLQMLTEQSSNIQKSSKTKKTFLTPQEITISEIRWKNYCTSTSRDLYGLNQKVRVIKRHITDDQHDISFVRLLAQGSLKSCLLLKGLLRFPSETRVCLAQNCANSNNRGKNVVPRVIAAATELLQLMEYAGIVAATVQPEADHSNYVTDTKQEEEGDGHDSSLLESEVVAALEQRGAISHHLAALAAEAVHTADGGAAISPGVGLPHGRSVLLLHDTLSHRLSRKQPNTGKRLGISRLHNTNIDSSTKPVVNKNKNSSKHPSQNQGASRLTGKLINSSHMTRKQQQKKRQGAKTDGKKLRARFDEDESSELSDGSEREHIWRQLMPLLAHQNVLLHGSEERDWRQTLERLDTLIQRLNIVEVEAHDCRSLMRQCRKITVRNDDSNECCDDGGKSGLATAIMKANKLLHTTGFLPPYPTCVASESVNAFSAGACAPAGGVASADTAACVPDASVRDSPDACYDSCKPASDSGSVLDDLRRRREQFWIGLAQAGYVNTQLT